MTTLTPHSRGGAAHRAAPPSSPRPGPAGPPRPGSARDAAGRGHIDVHQHLWPEPFLAALSRRRDEPRIMRRAGGWVLRAQGEPEWPVHLADHDAVRRAGEARVQGVARALVAPSCPIGVERLPADQADELVDAYHRGVRDLPAPFGAWAAAALAAPDPVALAARLREGLVGLCLPAGAIATPASVERVAPLLAVLERAGRPLMVHPGPGLDPPVPHPAGAPAWWPALVPYVAGLHAAWWTHLAVLRPAFPRLRVCFAMLAGLAPLQADRLAARGGQPTPDARTYLDTSSYGPAIVAAVACVWGADRLVPGSDRPVVAAAPPGAHERRLARNVPALLSAEEVTA